jgi:exoribonuclease R
MLPNKLYREIGSLKKGEPKLATSVSFILDENGLLDFDTVEYAHSVIEN